MLLLRGVHHFSVTVSFSPFSRVLVPAMCRSPAPPDTNTPSFTSRRSFNGGISACPHPPTPTPTPTVFKELQVGVSVMEELHVVIG